MSRPSPENFPKIKRHSQGVFSLMASAGFDGRVVADVSAAVKKVFGRGAYVLSGLKQIARGTAPVLKVKIEGAEHDASWVIVSNA